MNTVGRWFFLCFLIGVSCLLGFAYVIQSHLTDYFKQEKQQLMIAQVGLAESQIQDLLQQELQELGIWSDHPLVLEFAKKQVKSKISGNSNAVSISEMNYFAFLIENGVLADPNYIDSFLFNPEGTLIWGTEGQPVNDLTNTQGYVSWLNKIQKGLSVALFVKPSNPASHQTDVNAVVPILFGVPLIEEGQVIAILAIELDAKPRLVNILKNARLSSQSNVSLYNQFGVDILSLDDSILDAELTSSDLLDNLNSQTAIFQSSNNMFAWRWNQTQSIGVLLRISNQSINQSLHKIQIGILILVFVAIGVMVALLLVIVVNKGKLKDKQINIERHRSRLLHVQDLSHVACLEITLPAKEMIWSSGFEFIYDMFPGEVNSPYSLLNKLPSEFQTQYLDCILKVKTEQTNQEMEIFYEFPDNNPKYLLIKFFPQVDENNRTVLVLISDITGQKLKQKEAIQKEKEYRDLIIQSAHDGILSIDLSGKVTLFNQACVNLLGYQEESLKRMPIHQLVYASENAANTNIMQISGSTKVWLACQDGRRLPVDLRVSPIIQNGEAVGAVYLFRDISEQIEFEKKLTASEQRFRRVIEGTSDATFDWDMVNNQLHWNSRYWEMLGYTKAQAKISSEQEEHTWQEAIHQDDIDNFINAIQAHLIFGSLLDIEYRALRADKQQIWLRARGQAVKENGRFLYLSGTISDISQIKQAEHEKTMLETQLRHSQKMEAIGQLTGGIAHDFNNILASILGYAELSSDMLELDKTERVQPYLEQIIQSGERARDLIKQMMVFSRKETQVLKKVAITDLLDEAKSIIRPIIPSSINLELIHNAKVNLQVDPVQFQQLLINLAINARDAMPSKGKLSITSEITTEQGITCSSCHAYFSQTYVKISVQDTGSGIDAITLKKIFDPYFTSKGLGEGTGMGLSIVHGIVHQLGGHISVSSVLNEGTQFEVYLPFELEGEEDQLTTDKNSLVTQKVIQSEYKIYIVDDEISIAQLIAQKLKLKGYRAEYTIDSQQALTHLLQNRTEYDLLITDQTMPNMTGIELVQTLFENQVKIPVILCTGYSESVNEESAKAVGIYEYLEKPIQFNRLEQAIDDALKENAT